VSNPQPQLDYAPPPPLHRRRSFKRSLVAVTLVAVLVCGWMVVPHVWQAIPLLMQQRQAMRFVLPPDTVVYEPDPERAAKLWVIGSPYVTRPPGGAFYSPQIAKGTFSGHSVFLHGLRRPDGGMRLVRIEVTTASLKGRDVILRTFVAKPATFINPRVGGYHEDHDPPPGPESQPSRPRLFAGQPDPDDPSCFTMKYEYPDRSGVIHGRLTDSDTIEFEWTSDERSHTTQP
jgi:hypothetical protein